MRVAALYDIHGNLPALEAVLADLDRDPPDAIVCGGDLVAGPFPSECLELLRERDATFLRGNADRFVLERRGDDAWSYSRLSDAERAQVASWPETVVLSVDGLGDVLFCHGSPRGDEEMLTVLTRDDVVLEIVNGVAQEVVVCGHTHHQFDRRVGGHRVVNAGSVGLPYEGKPGAFWVLLGPDVHHRRTEYDVREGTQKLIATDYPRLAEFLRSSLLEPIPREEAIAGMEPAERRGA
jgi:putative phosphoesterase